jgi:hypothetical protein
MIPINPVLCAIIGIFLMMGGVGAIEHETMPFWKGFAFAFVGCVLALDAAVRMNKDSDV